MTLRLFVALDLPREVAQALPDPPPPWRAVRPEARHLTLAFLGPVDDARVTEVVGAVAAGVTAAGAPGELSAGDVVLLPPRRPRVMAVRVAGEGLAGLQAAVARELAATGLYVPEERPFLPHVTIGRWKERGARRAGALPAVGVGPFRAPHVGVYSSAPAPGGSRYTALARLALA